MSKRQTQAAKELPHVVDDDIELNDDQLDALTHAEVAKRPWGRRLTNGLVVVALIGSGFWGGAWYQKEHGSTSAAVPNFPGLGANGANRVGAGANPFGAGGATGGTANGNTSGQVKLVDGKNVYVTTSSGSIVKVTTSDQVTVTKQAAGKVTDIKPGDTVTVRGSTNSDGTVAATSISVGTR